VKIKVKLHEQSP